MKRVFKFLAWLVAIVVVLCAAVFFIAWKSPKYYVVQQPPAAPASFLPFKDYTVNHPKPYIVQKNNLVVFGAEHTRDPNHAEIALIEAKWNELKPTVALVEGRLGFLLPGLMDPVENLGEGGKVKELAHRDDVPLYNWDLSKEALANNLKTRFSAEQIALAQILNPYFSNLRFGRPSNPQDLLLFDRAKYVGLQDSLKTVEDIDRTWKKYFPALDWRDVSDEGPLPGYLADMMTAGNDLRNQQLIAAINELTAKGERVFVACGSSHAVCVAPAFQ